MNRTGASLIFPRVAMWTESGLAAWLGIAFAAMALPPASSAASPATLTVDFSQSEGPDNTLKRGWVMPFERNTQEARDKIEACAELGMEIINGHRKLNLDSTGESDDQAGGAGLEIYKQGNEFTWRADPNYVELLKLSRDHGLTVFAQVSGTSPAFDIDPEFSRVPFETRLAERHSKQGERGKEFELPVKDQWDDHAKVVSEWMRGVDKEVASRATREGEIIWIGSEEVAHTLGAREGEHGSQKSKEESVTRYVEFWTPLAGNLREMGIRSGGIQNNAANRGSLYDLTGDTMARLQTPVDFITIQNYQGENNGRILNQLRGIMDRMRESRPELYADTKILFDRYGWRKRNKGAARYDGAEGIVHGLKAELVALDNADILYGYCHMNARPESMTSEVFPFLNGMPVPRCKVTNFTEGVGSFAYGDESKFSMAVWNASDSPAFELLIRLEGRPSQYDGFHLTAQKGAGAKMGDPDLAWDRGADEIRGLTLNPNEFALIVLEE
jgi:hypothetical protein